MQDLMEQTINESFEEGVLAERARCIDLLKLLQPATIALVSEAISSGKEATDIFAQAIELTKPRPAETPPDEEVSRAAQASIMRRAFSRAASRVNGQQRTSAFSANRVASPESD